MMYFHPEILNEMVEKYIRSSQIILKWSLNFLEFSKIIWGLLVNDSKIQRKKKYNKSW